MYNNKYGLWDPKLYYFFRPFNPEFLLHNFGFIDPSLLGNKKFQINKSEFV